MIVGFGEGAGGGAGLLAGQRNDLLDLGVGPTFAIALFVDVIAVAGFLPQPALVIKRVGKGRITVARSTFS
ncbi:hypothetical protein [Roseovarius sp. CAU 1744]|uniref:hypothetical protein n=1 Tax=Roseovarius sp. CAU 1744 TaxID=3140368 RepID=UPI00325C0D75